MDFSSHTFKDFWLREAYPIENKIVYFGSSDAEATFVLEKEEGSEQLRVVREDEGLNFWKGDSNTASCVFEKNIYAF